MSHSPSEADDARRRNQSNTLLRILRGMAERSITSIQSSELVGTARSDGRKNVDDGSSSDADRNEDAGGKAIEASPTYLSVQHGALDDAHGPLEFVLIERKLVFTNKPSSTSTSSLTSDDPTAVVSPPPRSLLLSPYQQQCTEAILRRIPYAIRSRIPLFDTLARTFGALPMIALFLSYFLSKGIGAHLVSSGTLPIFKDVFKVSGGRYQAFVTITILGWSFKPILGLVSDLVAVRGYNKRGWLVLAAITGAICSLLFMFLPGPSTAQEAKTGWFVGISIAGAACAFFISVSQAALDLLFEGYYCSLMQLAPDHSSSLVSWVWGATMMGGIVAACMEGPIADYMSPRVVLAIVMLSMILILPVLARNWIGEVPFLRILGQGHNHHRNDTSATEMNDHNQVSSSKVRREEEEEDINNGGDEGVAVRHSLLANVPDRRDILDDAHIGNFNECRTLELPLSSCGTSSALPPHVPTFLFLSAKAREHKRVVLYAAFMGVSAIAIALSTLHFSSLAAQDDTTSEKGSGMSAATIGKLQLLWVTACASILLSFFSFKALPRAIASANVFMFLKEMLYVQMPGPLDYFFTAGPACLPNGPHFSYTYYQTFTSIVGYLAGGAGVAIFYRYFSKRSFRTTFYITTAIRVIASLFDLMLVTRTNQTFFGGWIWPFSLLKEDKVFYFLGDAIIYQAVTMMDFMPMVMLTSKMCPRGLECTTYAILAGFSNFGQVISNTIGSLLVAFVFPIKMGSDEAAVVSTATLSPSTTSTYAPLSSAKCDFTNLPNLLIVGHLLLPLLVLPLVPLLVPSQRMDEEIVHDDIPADEVVDPQPQPTPSTVE